MWQKPLIRLFLRPLLLITAMLGIIYLFQDHLLHHPEPIALPAALAMAEGLRLRPWPSVAETRGWLRDTPSTKRGTFVLFHGNGGHALHRHWYADELEKLGVRTILAEYPGYGHRSGSKGETSLAGDAAESIAAIRKQFDGPLFVAGESLGAGVAASALASYSTGVTGIMLITPWNDLASIASHHYPFLPVRLLLRDRYDSVANLQGFMGPKVVQIAEQDSIIPAEFGRALFERLGAKKKLFEAPNADHNDWMDHLRPDAWQSIIGFMEGS